MDPLVATLLSWLNEAPGLHTARELLVRTAELLAQQLSADLVICYELIPETGGVPRYPPVHAGVLRQPSQSEAILAQAARTGMLGDFIRHWQVVVEADAASWCEVAQSLDEDLVDLSDLLVGEEIEAFIFLPIAVRQQRLAAIFLMFRQGVEETAVLQEKLSVCRLLTGLYLAPHMLHAHSPRNVKKRMATAHTMYGQASLNFSREIARLQQVIQDGIEGPLPPSVLEQLQQVKHTVFAVMRNLVINAAGDLLVDLREMTLARALKTTAAALMRAWPDAQAVRIEILPVPAAVERQPFALREILYVMILELIGNAVEHGGPAPYINVDLRCEEATIYLQVIDHGIGFDLSARDLSAHGLGFWDTYVRSYLGGTFRVASNPGFGTVVTAQIPIL